jgi:hypothetical protein
MAAEIKLLAGQHAGGSVRVSSPNLPQEDL